MRVLVACEFSGIVRDAFAARGHDAWSCDLEESERGEPHYRGDVRDFFAPWNQAYYFGPFDLLIAHPPCTYLSRAGARWWRVPGREELANQATEFVFTLRDAPIRRIAIENPIGQLNQRWRYPDQTIQPYQFGHPYSKATCLWLKNLPNLVPTKIIAEYGPWVASNTSFRKRNGLPPKGKVHGAREASRTFQGIADAMADQWGNL
jgi:site-specific DNA-cytosine methylase